MTAMEHGNAPAAGQQSEREAKRWHELKTDPDVFDAVAAGVKTFEIRLNDRDYQPGDGLLLRRTRDTGWAMKNTGAPLEYTGEEFRCIVTYVLRGPVYGLADGWAILSFRATLPAAAACAEQGEAVAWRFRHRHLGPDAPWTLCDHEPDVPGLEVHPLFVDAAPKELLEAVDSVLETAPCECSHKQRYEIGGHKSYCFLFDLDIARNKCGASLPPPARNGEMSDEEIYAMADQHGFRYRTSDEEGMQFDKHAVLAFARAVLSASCAPKQTEDQRGCTCHPDDNPPHPCPRKYAYSECVAAAAPAPSAPADQPSPATKRQYYYLIRDCPAKDAKDPGCICWHDEGAGPVPTMSPGLLEWRTVTVTREDQPSPDKQGQQGEPAEVAYSTDEENFNFESVEEALDSMDDPQPGDVIYEGDVVQRPASHYLPKIEWLLEAMSEKAWDAAGEHADDWPGRGMTNEGCNAIEAGLKALVDQHVKVNFWTVANVRRIEVTAELLAASPAPTEEPRTDGGEVDRG